VLNGVTFLGDAAGIAVKGQRVYCVVQFFWWVLAEGVDGANVLKCDFFDANYVC
jgi:hypothetical protein